VKKCKKLLGIVLVFVMLAGIIAPFPTVQVQASSYTLTFLNPMGQITPRNNMPLADRQPLLDKLNAGGEQGPVRILLLHYDKNLDQMQLWALALLMRDYFEENFPGTTVELIPLDPTGGPMEFGVLPPAWDWYTAGRVPRLGSPWGPKSGAGHIDGMPLFEEPFARYQAWADLADFVLTGEQN